MAEKSEVRKPAVVQNSMVKNKTPTATARQLHLVAPMTERNVAT